MLDPFHRISIHEIARRAGVSATTVSFVINSKGNISTATRSRIMNLCRELHYQPHPTAQFLPRLRSRATTPLQTDFFGFTPVSKAGETSTYASFLEGATQVAFAKHKRIVYEPLRLNGKIGIPLSTSLQLDGRLLVGWVDDQVIRQFESENAPVVVMGDHQCQRPVWNVNLDNHAAGQMAVNHLWELGHRRIVLACQARSSGYQTEFKHGFQDALEKKGLPPAQHLIVEHRPGGQDSLDDFLRRGGKPLAVVAIEAGTALHTLMRAREFGIRVPEDWSLLLFGRFGDSPHNPTGLDPGYEEIGQQAMELLVRLREEPSTEPHRVLIQPKLKLGETCAPLPTN